MTHQKLEELAEQSYCNRRPSEALAMGQTLVRFSPEGKEYLRLASSTDFEAACQVTLAVEGVPCCESRHPDYLPFLVSCRCCKNILNWRCADPSFPKKVFCTMPQVKSILYSYASFFYLRTVVWIFCMCCKILACSLQFFESVWGRFGTGAIKTTAVANIDISEEFLLELSHCLSCLVFLFTNWMKRIARDGEGGNVPECEDGSELFGRRWHFLVEVAWQ